MAKNKLELQWPNKDKSLYFDLESGNYEWVDKKDPRVTEPRILVEKNHYGDKNSENILIKGDNLLALKALHQDFQRKIKLIFIDPPYNTGNAFEHYDDGLEHSIWLGLMKTRLESLHKLLANDGSLWITIDDDELHYLKVLCDEVFGRKNFIGSVAWEKSDSPRMDANFFSYRHDTVLVYAKNIEAVLFKKIALEEVPQHYNRTDENGRLYYTKPLRAMGGQGETRAARPTLYYPIIAPDGTEVYPKKQDGSDGAWRWNKEKVEAEKNRIDWVNGRNGWTPYYRIYADNIESKPPETIWFHSEVGTNRTSKSEIKALNLAEKAFDTPKPERLLNRIIEIASNEGDIILDSFAGSGTTGAVAHKMNRKWIMVELNGTADTHIIPRLQKVINGEDQGGISSQVGWKGGGGFKYFELGESLFIRDTDLRLTVLNPNMYNGSLIRAVLKVEGFKLKNPDNGLHGMSGTTVAHVTEQYMTQEYIDTLLNEIGDQAKFVVIYAKTISSKIKLPDNVEIRRIPNVLLKKFAV